MRRIAASTPCEERNGRATQGAIPAEGNCLPLGYPIATRGFLIGLIDDGTSEWASPPRSTADPGTLSDTKRIALGEVVVMKTSSPISVVYGGLGVAVPSRAWYRER